LRAGIDTGRVTSGLVGQAHIVYDLWGDAVNLAFQIQGGHAEAGIFITQSVADRLPETLPFIYIGSVHTNRGEERVLRIDTEPISV
jgi:class 3 adenylate cyclase